MMTSCPTSASPPAVASQTITPGETLTGRVRWEAFTTGGVVQAEFWCDNVRLTTIYNPPFAYMLDTTKLKDGPHQLGLVLIGPAKKRYEVGLDGQGHSGAVTVDNTKPPPPPPPSPPPTNSTPSWEAGFETGYTGFEQGVQCGRVYDSAGNWTQAYTKTASQQVPLVASPARLGKHAAQVILDPGDFAYDNQHEACFMIHDGLENQGDDWYYTFATWFPTDWKGSNGWGTGWELTVKDWENFPSYGNLNFDISDPNHIRFIIHAGLTADRAPGADYTPEYNEEETILSGFARGVWHDWIVHLKLSAYWGAPKDGEYPGVLEVIHKQQTEKSWVKLYSNVPGAGAVVQRAPHPTWQRNSHGTPQAELSVGMYSAPTPWRRTYFTDAWAKHPSLASAMAYLS